MPILDNIKHLFSSLWNHKQVEVNPAFIQMLIEQLKEIELFQNLPASILEKLLSSSTLVHLEGGKYLTRQGEPGDAFYIVLYGRLRIFREELGQSTLLGEVKKGDVVGEVSVITNEPRSASTYTIRDCILVKISKEIYHHFINKYPRSMQAVAQATIRRLMASNQPELGATKQPVLTLAILPAGYNPQFSEFVDNLAKHLASYGTVLRLNQTIIDSQHGIHSAQTPFTNPRNTELIAWLSLQENKYQYILYEASAELSIWSQRCIRQADRLLWVGLTEAGSDFNALEDSYYSNPYLHVAQQELVLIHRYSVTPTTNTRQWLASRQVYNHYHLRWQTATDYQRIARLISGNGLGLVLSGGGARGLGHIGVLQALSDLKIPIDYLAGSSMGAIIAGAYAYKFHTEDLLKQMVDYFKDTAKNFDYTLPIMSLFKGAKISKSLVDVFGTNTCIEDLWYKFFCISTNISRGTAVIHDQGLLWHSLRASMSLPGIFPPVRNPSGDLLVDGSVINDLPVDIMRQKMNGGKIITVRVSPVAAASYHHIPNDPSGWSLLKQRLSKNKIERLPLISEILISSMMVSSIQKSKMNAAAADYQLELNLGEYSLLNFSAYRQIVDTSYHLALKQLRVVAHELAE